VARIGSGSAPDDDVDVGVRRTAPKALARPSGLPTTAATAGCAARAPRHASEGSFHAEQRALADHRRGHGVVVSGVPLSASNA
jgi:hypothetical protein